MKLSLLALVLGFILDLIIGDPHGLYHPIRLVGNLIALLERRMNRKTDSSNRQMVMGWLMALIVIILSSGIPLLLLLLAYRIHPVCRLILETIMCWQLLATKSLKDESMKVYRKLKKHDLQGSRHAVSMIVGRDTEVLDETRPAYDLEELQKKYAGTLIGDYICFFMEKNRNTVEDKALYYGLQALLETRHSS